jgi:hypothetical protein
MLGDDRPRPNASTSTRERVDINILPRSSSQSSQTQPETYVSSERKALKTLDVVGKYTEEELVPTVEKYCLIAPSSSRTKEEIKIIRDRQVLSIAINDVKVRVSEALLQQMLKIDGMPIIADDGIRQRRRELVKWINRMLEQVDEHKGRLS